jgi:effector-binding domain-containing protein
MRSVGASAVGGPTGETEGVEIIEGPTVVALPEIPTVGIRVVTPFRGMLSVRDDLLAEVRGWAEQSDLDVVGYGFLRLHVIDMRGEMDIEVGLMTRERVECSGRVRAGALPAGRYATLSYRGPGTAANRALLDWAAAGGLEFERRDVPEGDRFACRYEAYLTDPRVEPHKKRWKIELAFKLTD